MDMYKKRKKEEMKQEMKNHEIYLRIEKMEGLVVNIGLSEWNRLMAGVEERQGMKVPETRLLGRSEGLPAAAYLFRLAMLTLD